ncbi:MAG TPA: hypothetical protein VFG60_00450 [Burkholderiaceae bacterium]|nr:hypothetical protein [Burkholderiaceae bacterium]
MTRLPTLMVLAALLPSLAYAQAAGAGATTGRAQAELKAVELKQGMTPDEVRELLGKPQRTALSGGGSTSAPSQGTLTWTYVWTGPTSASSSERSLHIDFAAKATDQWTVNGWGWSNY